MSQPTTAVLDIEKIGVQEGFNPRTRFDEDSLAKLEASLRETGLVQPLAVQPAKDGHYTLIAGERRLIAAKRAGIEQVPVLIREGTGARAAALAENLIREDLDPIDTARGLKALADAEGLPTHKQLAAKVEMSVGWVGQHLRLLGLPEGVQTHIATGHVPVEAERELRKIAKVSPRIAECACELVARGEIEGRDLVERFGEVLHAVAQAEFTEKPAMVAVARGVTLSELVCDPDQHTALAERYRAACPHDQIEDPLIALSESEVDAARAAGCLIESEVDYGGWSSTVAFICDAALAADLAVRAIERIEAQAAVRAKKKAEREDVSSPNGDPANLAEQLREARRKERRKAKSEAEAARGFNLELGRKLVGRRGAKSRREHSLARAKALALIVVADNHNLAAQGLRLALPQLQEVEIKRLKSGEPREAITYANPDKCRDYLVHRIEEARSDKEVLELMADALIAAAQVDDRELAQSRRVYWRNPAGAQVEKLLAPDVKAVRPRRRAGNRSLAHA